MLGSLAALAGTLVIAADRAGLHIHSPTAGQWLALWGQPQLLDAFPGTAAWSAAVADSAAANSAQDAANILPQAAAAAAGTAGSASGAASPAAALLGDGLMLFAALCYSASTVRIPAWAVRRRVPSLHLALGKSAFLAAVSAAALAAQAWQLAASGCAAQQLWPGYRRSAAGWALIALSALGPGALAAFLHVKVGCCHLPCHLCLRSHRSATRQGFGLPPLAWLFQHIPLAGGWVHRRRLLWLAALQLVARVHTRLNGCLPASLFLCQPRRGPKGLAKSDMPKQDTLFLVQGQTLVSPTTA